MIAASHLTKSYADCKAVNDVSFTVKQGECVGLLGLNGAGKTTLLRMLACLLAPTAGTARIGEADISVDSIAVRGRIGFLPEEPPLYGEMRVRDFLAFAARLRGVAKGDLAERVDRAISRCRLGDVEQQRIETLSYGFKKRVGIAQAIVHQPPLVLLDEPIAGLDPAQIVEMRDLIRALRGQHTLLLSSHILHEISQTCDRILVMHRGQVAAQGTEEELTGKLGSKLRIRLDAAGSRGALEKALGGLEGLEAIEIEARPEDRLSAELVCSRDLRRDAARAVVEAGLGLEVLTLLRGDLESVFLKLTGPREAES
ncbi:MAG: ABC transporter ATP-binding protein [Deltaproteobacteria bacterium]|nr:ABC transporter ATP-binding protein [Deltaproteobacteria bacterium]